MTQLPTVAIIGRPNTGKSTLFNRFVGRRKAIVSEVPGTTRDHVSHKIESKALDYLLIDTGGMGVTNDKDFEKDVFAQSLLAVEHADLILFTIDSREELTKDDHRIIELLRKKRRRHVPIVVVLTKLDNPAEKSPLEMELHEHGIVDAIVPVSATHNIGMDALQEIVIKQLKKLHFRKSKAKPKKGDAKPRIAIIGRPNVGKSSIINAMMSSAQLRTSPLLVSTVPGTTRDSTDTVVRADGRDFIFIDTAGLRRKAQSLEEIERYAMLRTIKAIESADVAAFVIDAGTPITQQDRKILSLAIERGKGIVILVNKADQLTGEQKKQKIREVAQSLQFCRFAKIILTSAKTRENLLKIFEVIDLVQRSRVRHIPTRDLRKWFERTTYGQPLGEIGKSKHITQADEVPPTFVVFVKNPKAVDVTQLRYLDNRLRETFGFDGTPVKWVTKSTMKRER